MTAYHWPHPPALIAAILAAAIREALRVKRHPKIRVFLTRKNVHDLFGADPALDAKVRRRSLAVRAEFPLTETVNGNPVDCSSRLVPWDLEPRK